MKQMIRMEQMAALIFAGVILTGNASGDEEFDDDRAPFDPPARYE